MNTLSLYVHIPFCVRRCTYCDFNTYSGMNDFIPEYLRNLCEEIRWMASGCADPMPVHTIYLGGGTPSILDAQQINRIINTIKANYWLVEPVEITLEANPGTLDRQFLQGLVESGINRISLGMQAASPEDLGLLGRIHQHSAVIESIAWARSAGIRNINLDLIFGIPGQTQEKWIKTLQYAVSLEPDHLSLYSLTIEEGTQLSTWWKKGLLPIVTDDEAADRYVGAQDFLCENGFRPYEISNWAKLDEAGSNNWCHHNLQYWRNLNYIGFGAGAHSFFNRRRFHNVLGIKDYIQRMSNSNSSSNLVSPAVEEVKEIDRWTEMEETMMLGLRLVEEGVNPRQFSQRFQVSPFDVFGKQINALLLKGLVEIVPEKENAIRLTKHGILLGNQVFLEFIGNKPPAGYVQNT